MFSEVRARAGEAIGWSALETALTSVAISVDSGVSTSWCPERLWTRCEVPACLGDRLSVAARPALEACL